MNVFVSGVLHKTKMAGQSELCMYIHTYIVHVLKRRDSFHREHEAKESQQLTVYGSHYG